jgi:Glyoxalase/Bleomycin resistance protein/Dioxygenase superfamily
MPQETAKVPAIDLLAIKRNLALPFGILGNLKQFAMVTHDLRPTLEALMKVGVGPWRVYPFDRHTVTDRTYRGKPGEFEFKSALADMPGLMWEVIQPLSGQNIYSDFLADRGEGMHHLLFECNGIEWEQKVAAFEAAGYSCAQLGKWLGQITFAYYDTLADIGFYIEIINIPPGWVRPEPEQIFGAVG